MTAITVTINGRAHGPIEVRDELSMNDFLREVLGMTGTKFGCGAAQCLACAVIAADRRLSRAAARERPEGERSRETEHGGGENPVRIVDEGERSRSDDEPDQAGESLALQHSRVACTHWALHRLRRFST